MAYTPCYPNKINWQNEPSEATALNDVNLNKMDSAIYTIDGRVVDMSTRLDTDDTAITNLQGNVSDLQGDMTTAQGNITALQNGKVDKETGKGLSTNDFTNAYKTKLDTIPTNANHVEIEQVVTEGTTLANITIDGTTTAIKGSDIEVDEELSPTSTNPVENKAIYDALNNLLPSKTVSGNPISISDASGFDAKALKLTMNPIQDLHGYSNPWVGGAGKNKLNIDINSYSTSGVAIDINNGVITLSNTATNNIQINLVTTRINVSDIGSLYKLVDDGSFTFSSNLYLNIRYYDSNNSAISNQALNSGKSMNLVIPNNATTFMPMAVIKSGVATNGTIKPMLMLQSVTDNSFAPYSNICPISGRTEASITRTGKNLFDEVYTDISTSNKYTSIYVGNGTYTISTTSPRFSGGGACLFFLPNQVSSGASTSTNGVWEGQTRTVTSTDGYVTIVYRKDSAVNPEDYKTQIELGSTATTYEPYKTPETHTHQYSETIYGGVDDFVNGGATSIYGYVDMSTLTWEKFADESYGMLYYTDSLSAVAKTLPLTENHLICSHYYGVSNQGHDGKHQLPDGAMRINNIGRIYVDDESSLTLAEFETKIANGDLCYELATPTAISTSAEEITLLKGNNVVSTNGDNIEMKYSVSLDSLLS